MICSSSLADNHNVDNSYSARNAFLEVDDLKNPAQLINFERFKPEEIY